MSGGTEELFREDAYRAATEATVVEATGDGVVLDRTVFYAAAGGQPGDTGVLVTDDGASLAVTDTRPIDGRIVHRLAAEAVPPATGTVLEARVDWARRHRLMRMHSCLHLLCAAVAEPVTGGQIAADKGRLDFAIAGEVPTKEAIGERLNAWIEADHPVRHFWIDADELDRQPDLVRTMSVRPPRTGGRVRLVEIAGIDLQACGGTHVRRTVEIGRVMVTKIESKGKQNRRFVVQFATP